jgi:hypothetical protein
MIVRMKHWDDLQVLRHPRQRTNRPNLPNEPYAATPSGFPRGILL